MNPASRPMVQVVIWLSKIGQIFSWKKSIQNQENYSSQQIIWLGNDIFFQSNLAEACANPSTFPLTMRASV